MAAISAEKQEHDKSLNYSFSTLAHVNQIVSGLDSVLPQDDQLLLGIKELMVNAIEHGNLKIGYALKTRLLENGTWLEEVTKRLALRENKHKTARLELDSDNESIKVTVTDAGEGFDHRVFTSEETDHNHLHGRGLRLAHTLAFDRLEFLENGRKVVGYKKLNPV